MSDLIDRKQVLDAIREWADSEDCVPIAVGVRTAARMVESAPAVDAVPVVHGHWIWNEQDIGKAIRDYCYHGGNAMQWKPYFIYCSRCLKGYCVDDNCMFEQDPDYCPNCGAKMDEEVSE